MCIYYLDRQDLTYTTEEHIIPSGLGGKMTLPKTYVSSQFNNEISKLEQQFIRESFVGWQRIMVGPGKRGNLNEKKQSKSKVHILHQRANHDKLSLGYIKAGKPIAIPSICLNTTTGLLKIITRPNADSKIDFEALKQALAEVQQLRIRKWYDNSLPVDLMVFGVQKGIEENFEIFFVTHEASQCIFEAIQMNEISNLLTFDPASAVRDDFLTVSTLDCVWNDDFPRIYGKMAFNLLARYFGDGFVKKSCFNQVRDWIAKGGDGHFADIDSTSIDLIFPQISWPDQSHVIVLFSKGLSLYAICSLYRSLTVKITLSHQMTENIPFDGLVCDWQSRREYRLSDYLYLLANKNNWGNLNFDKG